MFEVLKGRPTADCSLRQVAWKGGRVGTCKRTSLLDLLVASLLCNCCTSHILLCPVAAAADPSNLHACLDSGRAESRSLIGKSAYWENPHFQLFTGLFTRAGIVVISGFGLSSAGLCCQQDYLPLMALAQPSDDSLQTLQAVTSYTAHTVELMNNMTQHCDSKLETMHNNLQRLDMSLQRLERRTGAAAAQPGSLAADSDLDNSGELKGASGTSALRWHAYSLIFAATHQDAICKSSQKMSFR